MSKAIDIVIIGVNSAKTLPACLDSIAACDYPQDLINAYYVDGGSSDESIQIAETRGAKVIADNTAYSTPGLDRNKGWKVGTAEIVQFMDSDTVLAPDWLKKGAAALTDGIGAVCGDRRELYPDRTVYNWIGDQEWNGKPGESSVFGGDVLITREALEATGGYNPDLVAGEDPEFAHRVYKAGYRILRLDTLMTRHDLAMVSLRQYLKRSFRSGHAFAEVHAIHEDFYAKEVKRIDARAGLFLGGWLLFPLGFHFPGFFLLPLLGTMVLLRPRLFLLKKFRDDLSLTTREARIYTWHLSLVVIPQFFGVMRYRFGRTLSRPMGNINKKKI